MALQVASELILAIPMTLLSLGSLGSCAAVFIAGAGAGRSLWLLFTCGVLVSAFLCSSVARALVHKAAPYELLTLIVPQWLFLSFLSVIMKFKTSWQARLLALSKLPGFLLLLSPTLVFKIGVFLPFWAWLLSRSQVQDRPVAHLPLLSPLPLRF